MNKLYFLIGASGVGKTTASSLLENKRKDVKFIYPDKEMIIPSKEEMIKLFGSVEKWQEHQTIKRVKRVKNEFLNNQPVLIDTQSRFEFIKSACVKNQIDNFQVILFDCKDSIRNNRINNRGQSHLINQDMNNWARFLREDCKKNGCSIIDTTHLTVSEMTNALENLI
jgi:hypothetical protein